MTRCAGATGSWARLAAALAVLSACGGDDAGAAAGGGVEAAVSYYRDVKPIFDARCARVIPATAALGSSRAGSAAGCPAAGA